MARYTGPRCRLSRREGTDLRLKKRWSLERRESPPGQHGARRGKLSDYGIQLREKQKVKRYYGVLEKQFRRYYDKAARSKGVTGHVLLQFLERRLDNVIYQAGFGVTRAQARQIATHGLALVDGQKVNVPSFLVKPGMKITFKDKDATRKYIKSVVEFNEDWVAPAWLRVDQEKLEAEIVRLPERDDIVFAINEQLIVELYSK